jgi:predicted peptidase
VGRRYTENGVEYRYQIFFPRGYSPTKQWPVVVALHSAGEKGADGLRQTEVGVGPVVRAQAATFPAVVIFPQVPAREKAFRYAPVMGRLIDAALGDVNEDPKRLYLTGISFGGVLAYDIAYRNPGRFAALVQISTQVMVLDSTGLAVLPRPETHVALGPALRATPVWIFHGAKDGMAPVAEARETVAAFTAAGVPVKYTEYPDGVHVLWDRVYQNPATWTWLFAQHR